VGGGLVRSQRGWSEVVSKRKRKIREHFDDRVLGSGDFVERVLKEAEENFKRSFTKKFSSWEIEKIILKKCGETKVTMEEIKSVSRRAIASEVRSKLARDLVEKYGLSMAETARQLGVSTPAVSKILGRRFGVS
jgi:hypothetical protein